MSLYRDFVPGGSTRFSAHAWAMATARPVHSFCSESPGGRPETCVSNCRTVMASFPFAANSGR